MKRHKGTGQGEFEASSGRGRSPAAHLEAGYKPSPKELKLRSAVCECTVCGEFFTSVTPFDRHFILLDKQTWETRCRTPREMEKIGMVQNENGVWMKGVSQKRAREHDTR